MVQSQLSAYSGSDPIWGFVALVSSELFTGEAAVGLDPRVRLFAVEGHIYFAEREDDAPVATRLVNCGAITPMQLARGAVQAGGQESLARIFQRDVTIDRDAVELTIATATETLLASIAHNPVGMPEVFPLRHHPAGLHHWLRATPLVAVPEEFTVAEPVAEPVADVAEVAAEPPAEVEMPSLVELPAPVLAAPAEPEWPRVDDEPMWSVPTNANDLPEIGSLVAVAEPPVVEPLVIEPLVIEPLELEPLATEPRASTPAVLAPPMPAPTVSITPAELPQLAALSSFQPQPTPPTPEVLTPKPPEGAMPVAAGPVLDAAALPKLAAGPMSVKALKEDLNKAAASSEPWSAPSHNMAAVQIWEMVDDLFEEPNNEQLRVGGGSPQERSHGWRPKKS